MTPRRHRRGIDAEADRAKKRAALIVGITQEIRDRVLPGIHDDLAAKLDAIEAAADDEQVPA